MIDRQRLVDWLLELTEEPMITKEMAIALSVVYGQVMAGVFDRKEEHTDQSTEEFVRAVRCYECRYRIQSPGWNCAYHKVETDANDYCSRGEKR